MGPFKHGSNPHSILGFFSNDFLPTVRALYRRKSKCDSDFKTSPSSSETSSIASFSPPTPSSPLPLLRELDSSFYKEMDSFNTTFDSNLAQYGSQPSVYDENAMFNSPVTLSSDQTVASVDPLRKQVNLQNEERYPSDVHNGVHDEYPCALSAHPTKEALQAFQTTPTSTEDSNVNPAASTPLPYVQMEPMYFSVFASDDTQHPEFLTDAAGMESTSNALDLFIPSDTRTSAVSQVGDYQSYCNETQVAHPQVQQNEGSSVDKSLLSDTAHSQNTPQSSPSSFPQGRQLRSSTRKRMIRPLDEDSDGIDGSKSDNDPDWHPGVSKLCRSKRAAASMSQNLTSAPPLRNPTPLSSLSFDEDESPKRKRKRTSKSEADESPKKKKSKSSSSSSSTLFRCNKCEKTFSRSADRERHKMFFHALLTLPCPTCSSEFSRKDAQLRHVRSGCKGKGRKRRTRRWELEIKLGIEGARDPTAEELDEDYDEEY